MKRFVLGILLSLGLVLHAVEVDYKGGVTLAPSGTENAVGGYVVERPWAVPQELDRKTILLLDSNTITPSFNARHYVWTGSNPDQTIIGATDPNGVLRGKVDGDLNWKLYFAGNGGANLCPAFSSPFTFASLTNIDGTSVVGRTGDNHLSVGALTRANETTYQWYGILDSNGDQWHTITVAGDETSNPAHTSNYEFWASDGAVHNFIVNPQMPGLSITGTGDAQWYTTPPKAYFQPRIVPQTTYFDAHTGSLAFTLIDINGNNISYRINGGAWVNSGATSVALSPTDFPLTGAATPNTLDYYYAGVGSTSKFKTRTMVKNPDFPSKLDSSAANPAPNYHGTQFLLPGDTWTARQALMTTAGKQSTIWLNFYDSQLGANFRTQVQANWGQGFRYTFVNKGGIEAILAKIKGANTTAAGSGITLTYLQLLHRLAVDNSVSIDNVGLEKNQAGVSASSSASLGSRENIYRGYYDVNVLADLTVMYDIAMGFFRTDQGFTITQGGFTAIDDYKIRDDIARTIEEGAIFNCNFWDSGVTTTGMWDTARNCYALGACYIIPSYSSQVFGTCGLDGNTTTYPYNPFPNQQYTWKQILIDQNYTLGTFPDLNRGFGLENSPTGLFDTAGTYRDKQSYLNMTNMGHAITLGIVMSRIHNPSRTWPCTEAGYARIVNGTIRGLVQPSEGRGQYNIVTALNRLFPNTAPSGYAWALPLSSTDDQRMSINMTRGFVQSLLWIDEGPIAKPGNPSSPLLDLP